MANVGLRLPGGPFPRPMVPGAMRLRDPLGGAGMRNRMGAAGRFNLKPVLTPGAPAPIFRYKPSFEVNNGPR